MPYQFSPCIAVRTPELERALDFYENTLGFTRVSDEAGWVELRKGTVRWFVGGGEAIGPVMELIVPDVEKAREELVAKGGTVVVWNGAGNDCYIRDPFGFLFNLYEDPKAFADIG
jgi:catechol 2,3-dioxygenase-like lactoylglutathione lyase family enzyme